MNEGIAQVFGRVVVQMKLTVGSFNEESNIQNDIETEIFNGSLPMALSQLIPLEL